MHIPQEQNLKRLVVLIPAYNEEKNIKEVINEIPKAIDGIDKIFIVVIDDGSMDNTSRVVRDLNYPLLVRHNQNRGVGAAIKTGIDKALELKADVVVNMDADGQFNPGDISKLVKPILEKKADCVLASRLVDKKFIPINMPRIKIWGNKLMARIISFVAKKKFYDVSCGFRAYSKEAILSTNLFGDFTYTQEIILDLNFKQKEIIEIPINVKYFNDRKSRVAGSLFKYALRTLRIILQIVVDFKPFSFFGSLGFISIGLGLLASLFLLAYYLKFGMFTPYKFWGVLGGFLIILGILFIINGLLANIMRRMRITQDTILYHEKKKHYYNKNSR